MIKCSMCTSYLTEFTICPSCGKGYCKKHYFSSCPFCRVGTIEALAVVERRFESWEISWITGGNIRFGRVGFVEIRGVYRQVLTYIRNNTAKVEFEIIVFPSKKMSNSFRSRFSPRPSFQDPNIDDPDETSRFSVAFGPGNDARSIMLNSSALEPGSVNFVLSLLLAKEYDVSANRAMIGSKKIGQTIVAALTRYNAKLGIPFVASNAHTWESYASIVNYLNQSYTMFTTLRAIVIDDNLEVTAQFIEKHIGLILSQIKWELIHRLDESLNLVWNIIEVLTVIAGVSKIEALRARMAVLLERHLDALREKLKDQPDTMEAVNKLVNRLAVDEVYASRNSFIDSACEAFLQAVTQFGPHFDRADEILELMVYARGVGNQLELGQPSERSNFASLTKTLDLLSGIFHRQDIYPEIPIHA